MRLPSGKAGQLFFLRQIVDKNFRTAAGTYGHYQPRDSGRQVDTG